MQTRPLLALPGASGMARPPVKVVASVKRRYQSVADGRPGRPTGHRRIYGTFSIRAKAPWVGSASCKYVAGRYTVSDADGFIVHFEPVTPPRAIHVPLHV